MSNKNVDVFTAFAIEEKRHTTKCIHCQSNFVCENCVYKDEHIKTLEAQLLKNTKTRDDGKKRNMVHAYCIGAFLVFLKVIFFIYDAISFIPYYVIYRPDLRRKESNRIKANSVGDNGGPYRAIGSLHGLTSQFKGCDTLDDLLIATVKQYGPLKCLGYREILMQEKTKHPNGDKIIIMYKLSDYIWMTYDEVYEKVIKFGRGLLSLGQMTKTNIIIFAETSPWWMIAAQACFKYNFPVVTLCDTLEPDEIVQRVNETEVSFIITCVSLFSKFKGIIYRMPKVKHIIYLPGKHNFKDSNLPNLPTHVKVLSMDEVENIGTIPDNLNLPVTKPQRDDIAVIIYTSGSTGQPKGVLISHGNLLAGMSGLSDKIKGLDTDDILIAYLTLAHVLELSAEITILANGARIGYGSPTTLTDTCSELICGTKGDVTALRPTLMTAVPAILDMLSKRIWEKVTKEGKFIIAMFKFVCEYKSKNICRGYKTPLLDKFIFQKTRNILGGRIRMVLSGDATLSAQTQIFMNVCFCCPVLHGYGLIETCGTGTIQEGTDLSTGRVGAPLHCTEIRLRDWVEGGYRATDKPLPSGEILIGGENVAKGYYKMEDKTKEDFTEIDGVRYFCTGDIGQIEEDGCLAFIDRKTDFVQLKNGGYVSLNQVETTLKMCSFIEHICAYGSSHHDFIIAIVVPSPNPLKELADSINIEGDIGELCRNDDVKREVVKRIAEYGLKADMGKLGIPEKVILIPKIWIPQSGLLTYSLKLKRKVIEKEYGDEIEKLYSD